MKTIFFLLLSLILSINAQTIDTLGYTTIATANNLTLSADRAGSNLYTASTSGTLQKAYFYNFPIGAGAILAMSVYLDDGDGTWGSGDTRIDTTDGETLGATVAWNELTFINNGEVVSGNSYWIIAYCYSTSPQSARTKVDAGLSLYWDDGMGWATGGHPATLPSNPNILADFKQSIYVTYQQSEESTQVNGYGRYDGYQGY